MEQPLSVPPSSSASVSERCEMRNRHFSNLRGLQWRINLGILPSSPIASIDDLCRLTADSRRRYASLRRRLLIDPHVSNDGTASPDLAMDNPLSLNPDSSWGRFFRNAELEKMVDQDLSRLYPEHDSYFQTAGCQGMLRRILLLWCLRHTECGYRQGMHELLAPILYVLQIDVERLTEVRKLYDDHFTDRFDALLYQVNDLSFDFRKSSDLMENEVDVDGNEMKIRSPDELETEIQTVILLSDAYGAEGELGIVLSQKFMEHDAYTMFDALMSGAHGSVAMADFFSFSPAPGSSTGLPPVLEASAAMYHLLSLVDSSLHSHLVDIGAEPQYFALCWLWVLFGREFTLKNLLIIWDEIFASDNSKKQKGLEDDGFMILESPRGAFIASMAVSMLLYLRSSLLAAENATACLQRLLNFPLVINIRKLLEKAKSLQALVLNTNISSSPVSLCATYYQGKSPVGKCHTLSCDSVSPKSPLNLVPESYWEEQWRVRHHKAEEVGQSSLLEQVPTRKNGWTEKVKSRLKRTESDPLPGKVEREKREIKPSVRRNLLNDLCGHLGTPEDGENKQFQESEVTQENSSHEEVTQENSSHEEVTIRQDGGKENRFIVDDRCLGGSDNSSLCSDHASPHSRADDHEIDFEKSSVGSNISMESNERSHTDPSTSPRPFPHPHGGEAVASNTSMDQSNEHLNTRPKSSPPPLPHPPGDGPKVSDCKNDSTENLTSNLKERKLLSGKFEWLWKFGRNSGEGTSDKGGYASGATKPSPSSGNQDNTAAVSTPNGYCSSQSSKGEIVDQNVTGTLRNLGQSMLDHIQVIESVFQQDRGQGVVLENCSTNGLVGKSHIAATTALKELRKISNLLSEM